MSRAGVEVGERSVSRRPKKGREKRGGEGAEEEGEADAGGRGGAQAAKVTRLFVRLPCVLMCKQQLMRMQHHVMLQCACLRAARLNV